MTTGNGKEAQETVKWFALSKELLPKKGVVVAAVSGGADSVALLYLLHGLSSELGFRVAVAHFDHGLRPGGERERDLVAAHAQKLGASIYAGQGDVRAAAEKSGDTIEEAARKARYAFLVDVADKIHAERIATGHTLDDQVETVLMRMLRGTGIRGIAGIPPRRGRFVRPLLCLRRSDTVSYCEGEELDYVEDPTNLDTRHFRNRIRHNLIPLLKSEYHAAVEENIARLARNAQDAIDHWRRQTAPLLRQALRQLGPGEWALNISKIAPLDDTAIFVLFGDVFAESLGCDMDFARVHYERLAALVKDARGSGKRLELPGLTVKREYENLIITKGKAPAEPSWHYRTTLTFPGETDAGGVHVTTQIIEADSMKGQGVGSTDSVAYFALRGLKLPLVLRTPEPGDRMRPFGMVGTKKLSDIFTDKKIPARRRARSLVIADANEILWLVGVATSENTRIHGTGEQVVKITVTREYGRA